MYQYENIVDVFDILNNNHVSYLVLRNYENLLEPQFYVDGHGDLDLLCADSQEIVRLLDAQTDRKDQYPFKGDGIHYYIYIGGERVSLDLRYVGDDYYCLEWEKDLLNNRVMHNGFYVMDRESYFYTLIYHSVLQKASLSAEYLSRLSIMAQSIGLEISQLTENGFLKVLESYMRNKGYVYTYPVDYLVPARFQLVNHQMILINWKRWIRHWMHWRKIGMIELLVRIKHILQGRN